MGYYIRVPYFRKLPSAPRDNRTPACFGWASTALYSLPNLLKETGTSRFCRDIPTTISFLVGHAGSRVYPGTLNPQSKLKTILLVDYLCTCTLQCIQHHMHVDTD